MASKVKKDRDVHENEVSQILKIIKNLRYFRDFNKSEVCRLLEINYRNVVYWESGEYGRGIKDFDLYPRVIKNCLKYYETRKPFSDKEIRFHDGLKRINLKLEN